MNYVDAPTDADFAFTVRGDGMEPDYLDGDIVYILRRDDVPDGAVAVALVDDGAKLMRVYKNRDGMKLLSINPKYAPIESETARIIGIPCGFTRMFKQD